MQVSGQQQALHAEWRASTGHAVLCLAASPDGQVAAGCEDSALLLSSDSPAEQELVYLSRSLGPCTTICIASDRVVGAGPAGMLWTWSTVSGDRVGSMRLWATTGTAATVNGSQRSRVLVVHQPERQLLAVACTSTRLVPVAVEAPPADRS